MPTPRKTPTDGGRQVEQQVRETLDALLRFYGWNQSELARRANMGRPNVQSKLSGRTQLYLRDLAVFAQTLDIPIETLFLSPADAWRWALDNKGAPGPVIPLRRASSSGQSARTKRVAGGRARTAANRRQGGLSPASPKGQLPVQFGPRPNLRVVTCA